MESTKTHTSEHISEGIGEGLTEKEKTFFQSGQNLLEATHIQRLDGKAVVLLPDAHHCCPSLALEPRFSVCLAGFCLPTCNQLFFNQGFPGHMQTATTAEHSYVHLHCCVQKILFPPSYL